MIERPLGKKVSDILQRGMVQGESLQTMARELKNATNQSFNNAFRLIRTETASVDSQVTLEGYKQAQKELGLKYFKYDAHLDSRTSAICREMNGKIFKIDDYEIGVNAPPLHPNCRSTTQLILDEEEEKEPVKTTNYSKKGNSNAKNDPHEEERKKTPEKPVEYQKFKNVNEVNKFFYENKEYQNWVNNLSEDTQEAIAAYTDNSDDVNKYLRKIGDWEYINKDLITDQIRQIDNALKDFVLKEPIQVIRGVDFEPFKDKLNDLEALVGTKFNDKAYLSTSPLESGAKNDKPIEILINIAAGKGRGAYINQLSVFEDVENEFLIARDSNFIIKNAFQEAGKYSIEMDLLID